MIKYSLNKEFPEDFVNDTNKNLVVFTNSDGLFLDKHQHRFIKAYPKVYNKILKDIIERNFNYFGYNRYEENGISIITFNCVGKTFGEKADNEEDILIAFEYILSDISKDFINNQFVSGKFPNNIIWEKMLKNIRESELNWEVLCD